jgi:hypothetical protein
VASLVLQHREGDVSGPILPEPRLLRLRQLVLLCLWERMLGGCMLDTQQLSASNWSTLELASLVPSPCVTFFLYLVFFVGRIQN